jgi:endonuclease/exonuclease/phosphatase family metal-dependent hydrolase
MESPPTATSNQPPLGIGIPCFRWNGATWAPTPNSAIEVGPRMLRLATMNILADCFPWFVRLAIASEERFEALCKEVEQLDATVVAMNEVTASSLEALLASEFVKNNYYVTELPENCNDTIQPHGCVILSKLPFVECYKIQFESNVRGGRAPVVGVFAVDGKRVAVCSLHTTAHQTPKNQAFRATQIARTNLFLRSLNANGGYHIIGDLNLHYICEDGVIPQNNLLDMWAETHFGEQGDMDPGFTFDANTNMMIHHYIPAERRRMRLDRMLSSQGNCLAPVSPVQLWGHRAVDEWREIFLSDHYGLTADLEVTGAGFTGTDSVKHLLEQNGQADREPSSFSTIRFVGALGYHVPWLVLRATGRL